MRWILGLVIIAAACFVNYEYSPHHVGSNDFETLYLHLMPVPLVTAVNDSHEGEESHAADTDEHAVADTSEHAATEAMLEIPLPAALSIFDYRGEKESAEPKTALFNLQIFQVASVLLCLLFFAGVPRYVRTRRGDHASRMFSGWAMWIRDEMVYPVMGKEMGRKFLPYFLSVFFFIVFMNLAGLIPFSATPTSSIFVTMGLALTTLVGMIGCGMVVQGPWKFWKSLVPHVPWPLLVIMVPVELVGLMVKPFALMIRLFANMTGGHMVVLSFMGVIFYMATLWGDVGGWGAAPIGLAFAVFIMIIEAFVALLQAYIFTQLSIIFIGTSIHPEH